MAIDIAKKKSKSDTLPRATESVLLEWRATEQRTPNSQRFFAVVTVGGLIVAIILYLIGQWMAVIVTILAVVAALTSARLGDREHRGSISAEGMTIDNTLIPFTKLKSFWLLTTQHGPMLHLELSGRLGRVLHLPLTEAVRDQVRAQLLTHLPEETERGEEFGAILARWLRL